MRISRWRVHVSSPHRISTAGCAGPGRTFGRYRAAFVDTAMVLPFRSKSSKQREPLTPVAKRPARHPRQGPPDLIGDSLGRSEEHTSELHALMRISYAVFSLTK